MLTYSGWNVPKTFHIWRFGFKNPRVSPRTDMHVKGTLSIAVRGPYVELQQFSNLGKFLCDLPCDVSFINKVILIINFIERNVLNMSIKAVFFECFNQFQLKYCLCHIYNNNSNNNNNNNIGGDGDVYPCSWCPCFYWT